MITQSASDNSLNETLKPFQRVSFDVSFVQSPREFVDVAVNVLLARLVVDAMQSAPKYSEHTLDSVCSDAVAGVDAKSVIYGFVLVFGSETSISLILVGLNRRALLDVLTDSLNEGESVSSFNRQRASTALAFSHSDDRSFVRCTGTLEVEPLPHVLKLLSAAYVDFIHFDNAFEQGRITSARFSQTLQHKPCRSLPDSNLFRQLHRRDSFASRGKQVHRINPLVKGYVRPSEDRPCSHSEVKRAGIATVVPAFTDGDFACQFALRADRAVRPEAGFKVFSSGLSIGEEFKEFEGAYRASAHLGLTSESNTTASLAVMSRGNYNERRSSLSSS